MFGKGKAKKAEEDAKAERLAQKNKESKERREKERKNFELSKKYKVLRHSRLDTHGTNDKYDDSCLEKIVNEYIDLGWKPQGNVFMSESRGFNVGSTPNYDYCQIMVKY